MVVTLNGLEVETKKGIIINEKLSEKLDSGFMTIVNSPEISIEPMDRVVITSGSYQKNMLVSEKKRRTKKYKTLFNYDVPLISPTIQLQRIVLPNRSVTQPLSGLPITIEEVIIDYVDLYTDFTVSTALLSITSGVICPEFQWNRPTLFEVLNDLLREVDAVVTMTSFTEISYLLLSEDGNAIDDDWTDVIETQNIAEYANKIECEVENAIVGYKNSTVTEYIAIKTDNEAIATVENGNIALQNNVYKPFKVLARLSIPSYSLDVYQADLTGYIVNIDVYNLLEPDNSPGWITGSKKRNRFYYEEGSNIIGGLTYQEDLWIPTISSKRAIINIFRDAYLIQQGVDLGAVLTNNNLFDIAFIFEYQAFETVKFISNKKNQLKNKSTLINNQDTSFVDFNSFSRKQQQTVNQIGNPTKEFHGKRTLSNMPSLNDNDGDYVLSEREFSIYDDFVNFKGIANKYFVMKDLFTGIKSQRRFTSLATKRESLESNHITEMVFNLSQTSLSTNLTFENYMLKFGEANENIKVVNFRTNESADDFAVAPSFYYTQSSVILKYKMFDNFAVGITTDVANYYTNSYGITYAPYTDSDDRFEIFTYKLYKSYDVPYIGNATNTNTTDWETGMRIVRDLPIANITLFNGLIYSSGVIFRYKDNREITAETIQYNFNNDSNTGFGIKFFQNHPMLYSGTSDLSLRVAYSLTETYKEGDQTYKGIIANPANLTYAKLFNYIQISSPDLSLNTDDFASWAIVDTSGNIFVWNNGNNHRVHLNKEG